MNLRNIKGEQALDTLAEILEPAADILGDEEIAKMMKANQKLKAAVRALREYKPQVIKILAAFNGEEPETYKEKINVLTAPVELMRLFNEPEVVELLFQSQAQMMGATSSGPATENTEDHEN